MYKYASWISVPESEYRQKRVTQRDMNGRFAYFRHLFHLEQTASLTIDITANARYRLWVNGVPVASGPCKGDRYRHFFDTHDVSACLRTGMNLLAVQVLACEPNTVNDQYTDERLPLLAVASVPTAHRLLVEGSLLGNDGQMLGNVTTGHADWRVYLDTSYYLKNKDITGNLGGIIEEIDMSKMPYDWKNIGFDASGWCAAEKEETAVPSAFNKRVGFVPKFSLQQRNIPNLLESEKSFVREITKTGILNTGMLAVNANSSAEILLDAGELENAYMVYGFTGGKGATVSLTYFERFTHPSMVRSNTKGEIVGLEDTVVLSGAEVRYEPFWYRTFRYLRITVQTAEEPMHLSAPGFRETGYPIDVQAEVSSKDAPWVEDVWAICERTLKRCMMETYMDCPFYEQMQFIMDTRLQALFTYCVSGDTRLAKKAIEDFHCSMTPDGLMHGKYPSSFPQIITTFSLYFIFMLHEYYLQTGDADFVARFRPDVDAILGYYERKIGPQGLVEALDYWPFVDWQKQWVDNHGVPAAASQCPSTIINLMYGYALLCGAAVNEKTGRHAMGAEYRARQAAVAENVYRLCWNAQMGLLREGPDFEQYTQHAQAWAVLNGMFDEEQGRKLMKQALSADGIIPCSFSTSYELFRALEKVGLYGEAFGLLDAWRHLVELDCTTCPEEPTPEARSECHAWSALPLYEFIRCVGGVQMDGDAQSSVRIQPNMGSLRHIRGKTVIPKGEVVFEYRAEPGDMRCTVTLPEGCSGVLVLKDGREHALVPGENAI